MSIFESRSRQSGQTLAWSRFQDSRLGGEVRLVVTLFVLAAMATAIVTDQTLAQQLYEGEKVVTVTNAYWVRLRSTPEIRPDTVLTRVAGGAQLRCLEVQDEWFKVQLSNGSEGWLHKEYGRLDSARDRLRVSASVARIRETPKPGAPVVGRAIQGLMLEIIEKDDQWYLVRLPLGEEGWVRGDLVKLFPLEPKPQQTELTPAEQPDPEEQLAADLNEAADDQGRTSLLEMTPLPISANASSGEDESGSASPTLRSPQSVDKPTFLMLFVSVIAGLTAFAVILVVGAVAVRRRRQREESIETAETDAMSPPQEGVNQEYTDPLLKWVTKSPNKFEDNGKDQTEADREEPEPPARTEPFPISIRKEETSSSDTEVEESSAPFVPESEPEEEQPVDTSLQDLWLKNIVTEEEPTERSELPDEAEPLSDSAHEEDSLLPPAEPKDSSLSLEFDLEPEEAPVVSAFQEQWAETLSPQDESQEQEYPTDSEPFPISIRQEPSESVETQGSTVRIYPVADEPETEAAPPPVEAAAPLAAVSQREDSQSAETSKSAKTRSSRSRNRKKGKRRRRRRSR